MKKQGIKKDPQLIRVKDRPKIRGFTLLEVIVAIFILTVGVTAILALISNAIAFTSVSTSRAIAAYLLQEGIEIVRNIRDGNWLENYYRHPEAPAIPWDEGIPIGNWEADYQTQNLTQAYTGRYLNIDGQGFYSYSPGSQTKFKRKINIAKPGLDVIEVFVEVEWEERGKTYSLSGQENLYNWFSP